MLTRNSFFDSLERIAASNYVPTFEDNIRACNRHSSTKEYLFIRGNLRLRIIELTGYYGSDMKKYIRRIGTVNTIVFTVDLTGYDVVSDFGESNEVGRSTRNRMLDDLELFDAVVHNRWLSGMGVLLLFNRADKFKAKLPSNPLEKYYPDYSGGADFSKAARYVLRKFNQVNRGGLNLYPQLTTEEFPGTSFQLLVRIVQQMEFDRMISDFAGPVPAKRIKTNMR